MCKSMCLNSYISPVDKMWLDFIFQKHTGWIVLKILWAENAFVSIKQSDLSKRLELLPIYWHYLIQQAQQKMIIFLKIEPYCPDSTGFKVN